MGENEMAEGAKNQKLYSIKGNAIMSTEVRTQLAPDAPFICAICLRSVPAARRGNCFEEAPVCRRCTYASVRERSSYYNDGGTMPRVAQGTFRDRFITQQIGAVADELSGLSHRLNWERRQR